MPEPKDLAAASIQSHVRSDNERAGLVLWLASAGEVLPAWWSTSRDKALRDFWKRVDVLAGAVYALESKMATIPFRVEPKDYTIRQHVAQAERFEAMLQEVAEWGQGWSAFYGKWTQDLLTQDNGAFAEILGEGDPAGPILGMPISIASLDSGRCTRTSNPAFPVIYTALDGRRYKLHYTRVAFASLQPSPIAEMHNVGFCSVSKCVNIAQNLLDILIYNQEKLGSRPSRGLMVTRGGLDPEDIRIAFQLSAEAQNNAMLTRFSKTVVAGSGNLPDASLELHDLASLPDGFDYEASMQMGMAAIALAFGVDARELWPMTSTGSTRADALIQHLKAQTKGIGHLLALAEQAIFKKVLPPTLTAEFDYTDDAQDRQEAEIKKVRADRHMVDLTQTGSVDTRTVREQMLNDGDLTQAQFDALELEDGRLEDGTPVLQVFYDPDYRGLLRLGLPDPLDTEANDKAQVMLASAEVRKRLVKQLGQERQPRMRNQLLTAMAALDALKDYYEENKPKPTPPPPPPAGTQPPQLAAASDTTPNPANETVTDGDLTPADEEQMMKGAQMIVQAAKGSIIQTGADPKEVKALMAETKSVVGLVGRALDLLKSEGNRQKDERDAMREALTRIADLFSANEQSIGLLEKTLNKQGEDGRLMAEALKRMGADLVTAVRSLPTPQVTVGVPVVNVPQTPVELTLTQPDTEEVFRIDRDSFNKMTGITRTNRVKR